MEILLAIIGVVLGAGGTYAYSQRKGANASAAADKLVADAKHKASDIVLKAKDEAIKLADEAKKADDERRKEFKKAENRMLIVNQTLTANSMSSTSALSDCGSKTMKSSH